MKIQIEIHNDDADECPDEPWVAMLKVTMDDDQVAQCSSIGLRATSYDAVMNTIKDNQRDADSPYNDDAERAIAAALAQWKREHDRR